MIAKVLVVLVVLGMAFAQMHPMVRHFPDHGVMKTKPGMMGMGMGHGMGMGTPSTAGGRLGKSLLYAPAPVVGHEGRYVYNLGGVGYPHYYNPYTPYYNAYHGGIDARYYNPYYYGTEGRYLF